jgi:hypothetical protein
MSLCCTTAGIKPKMANGHSILHSSLSACHKLREPTQSMSRSVMCRLRCLLLLWLLSSGEVLAVYSSVLSVAAPAADKQAGKGLAGGLFRAFRKGADTRDAKSGSGLVQNACHSGAAAGVCEAAKAAPRTAREIASSWRGGFRGEEPFDLFTVKLLLTACLATLNVACWYLPLKVGADHVLACFSQQLKS